MSLLQSRLVGLLRKGTPSINLDGLTATRSTRTHYVHVLEHTHITYMWVHSVPFLGKPMYVTTIKSNKTYT